MQNKQNNMEVPKVFFSQVFMNTSKELIHFPACKYVEVIGKCQKVDSKSSYTRLKKQLETCLNHVYRGDVSWINYTQCCLSLYYY